jgi:hypothetical protein
VNDLVKPPIRVICEVFTGTSDPTVAEIEELYPLADRILAGLVEEGHLTPKCGDCGVKPGKPHQTGCDVARCKLCGWQDIGGHVGHHPGKARRSTVWTGRWPGMVEVEEYGLEDLNEFGALCRAGKFVWSPDLERWVWP